MHTVIVRRTVAAPPEQTWRYFTEREAISRWFADVEDMGDGRVRLSFGDGDFFLARPLACVAHESLGLRWRFMDVGPEFEVGVALAPVDGGTEVAVRDRGAPTPEEAESLREGWSDFLARLGDLIAADAQSERGWTRYDWSPMIGTAALIRSTPVADALFQDAGWWRDRLPGVDVDVERRNADRTIVVLREPTPERWPTRVSLDRVRVEGATYVRVVHDGWEDLPEHVGVSERRRYAEWWASTLHELESR